MQVTRLNIGCLEKKQGAVRKGSVYQPEWGDHEPIVEENSESTMLLPPKLGQGGSKGGGAIAFLKRRN